MDYHKYVITVDPFVFRVLHLERLESLEVVCPPGYLRGIFWPNSEFGGLLERCKETLRSLVLDRVPLEEDEVVAVLQACRCARGLEELTLRRMRVGSRSLSLLAPSVLPRQSVEAVKQKNGGDGGDVKRSMDGIELVLLPSLTVLILTDEKAHPLRHGADRAFANLLLDRRGVSEPSVKVIWEEEE